MKYSGIGGQAVIEGVMMKGKSRYAVSVRKPDGQIEVKVEDYKSLKEKYAIAKLPIIRGIFAFRLHHDDYHRHNSFQHHYSPLEQLSLFQLLA